MASNATSSRARELERVYQMRRGHAPQISISDDNHHVTEAIGDMYGGDSDNESIKRNSRPLSFVPSPNGDSIQSFGAFEPFDPFPVAPPARSPLRPQAPTEKPLAPHETLNGNMDVNQKRPSVGRSPSNGQLSPPLSRSNSDTASHQFPLNDLDYESSPAGLAQELSNLQAIRRMSMGVNGADPDLPSFQSSGEPPLSPPAMSEEDETKLFWVPARLHPELAPKEFKTFIEEKVERMRRRSGDSDSLSPNSALGYQTSNGGLRRKKSMLSRQIDTGAGYKDGAERLERKRSGSQPGLAELENIVEDPSAARRMSIEAEESKGPPKMGGIGTLKRSTRTTYRRGSLRKGGPALSRRVPTLPPGEVAEESITTSRGSTPDIPDVPPLPILRVQSEPVNGAFDSSNFSRPQRRRTPPEHGSEQTSRPGSADEPVRPASTEPQEQTKSSQRPKAFHSRIASNGRTSANLPGYIPPHQQQQQQQQQVPQIIETPPPVEKDRRPPQIHLPERLSSRQPPPQQQPPQTHQPSGPRNYPPQQYTQQQQHAQQHHQPQQQQWQQPPAQRQNRHAQAANASPIKPAQSFDDLIQPSPLPGNNTRIDSLSIIPNLPEDKKSDKKSKDKKEDSRKTSWGWLVGGDKQKEKEQKEKEERDRELAKKVKSKLSKPVQEKGHDDARLDVLQTSLQNNKDGARGRESLVLDRESVKLEEERKKESNRKSGNDGKKEKEGGLLSSIFGGGKKKSEKETSSKKSAQRGLSPEPPPKILKPDIDYNWTRFSILEERAIYRMAHIKLANPRRELYSQVLLSNFMYSYLAKVQQMHPQISIGNSKQARQAQQAQAKKEQQPQQQQQEQQAQQQQQTLQQQQQQMQQQQQQQQMQSQQSQQQPEEFAQYQRYQQQQQQEQPEQSNEWPSYNKQDKQGYNRQTQENGYYQSSDPKHGAYNQNPRDSHHSQYSANGGGYSVANSQSYLGTGKVGHGRYSDSDQSSRADDDMW